MQKSKFLVSYLMRNQGLVKLGFKNVSGREDLELKIFHSVKCKTATNSKSYAIVDTNRAAILKDFFKP